MGVILLLLCAGVLLSLLRVHARWIPLADCGGPGAGHRVSGRAVLSVTALCPLVLSHTLPLGAVEQRETSPGSLSGCMAR